MKPVKNRITEMLGVEYPVVPTAMGWIVGGMGIAETSSGQFEEVRAEIVKMRDLTITDRAKN